MWIRFDIFPLVAIRVSASQILIFLYVPDHLLPFLYQTLFTKGVFMKRMFYTEAAYAAGLIEGYLSEDMIYTHSKNIYTEKQPSEFVI